MTDSASRSISYAYTANGELEKYRNPAYVQGRYEAEVKHGYDTNSKGLLKEGEKGTFRSFSPAGGKPECPPE